ncbi:hypothetical protein, partial [Streptomyces coelicoflavus]|uniref:hypothetical protein n=1 Tax=Streptomyces coelicoflavus TaxID=285562 RepID=UPI0040401829
MDPAYPADRIAYMLQDADPVAVVSAGPVDESVLGSRAQVVLDEPTTQALTGYADADLSDAERGGGV